MKEINKIDALLNIYGNLLSKCKFVYLQEYYFEDLSLQEIARRHNVSKAAVGEAINLGSNELKHFEKQLGFLKMQKTRIKFYQEFVHDTKMLEQLIAMERGEFKC